MSMRLIREDNVYFPLFYFERRIISVIVMGSIPIKNKRDTKKIIKKLWKEFDGKISIEVSKKERLVIYHRFYSYKNLEN